MKQHFTKNLFIPTKRLNYIEGLLCTEGADYDEMKLPELSTVETFTVTFDDGMEIDFKVNTNCRDDGDFYAEAVLFDKDGCQLDCTDPQYDFRGEWNLYNGNARYTVNIMDE